MPDSNAFHTVDLCDQTGYGEIIKAKFSTKEPMQPFYIKHGLLHNNLPHGATITYMMKVPETNGVLMLTLQSVLKDETQFNIGEPFDYNEQSRDIISVFYGIPGETLFEGTTAFPYSYSTQPNHLLSMFRRVLEHAMDNTYVLGKHITEPPNSPVHVELLLQETSYGAFPFDTQLPASFVTFEQAIRDRMKENDWAYIRHTTHANYVITKNHKLSIAIVEFKRRPSIFNLSKQAMVLSLVNEVIDELKLTPRAAEPKPGTPPISPVQALVYTVTTALLKHPLLDSPLSSLSTQEIGDRIITILDELGGTWAEQVRKVDPSAVAEREQLREFFVTFLRQMTSTIHRYVGVRQFI